jgi:CheY-like chemotaxis protein
VKEPAIIDVNEVVTSMEPMLRRLIKESVEFRSFLSSEPQWVRADTAELQQVILNLVINADDAMPTGGNLRIETGEVKLESTSKDADLKASSHVVLTVSDTGIGMDQATKSRAYDPFFTTKPTGRGTGMGLTTVQTIVFRSGGSLGLDTKPGEGTTVRVFLSKIDQVREAPKRPATRRRHAGKETILVVEDDDRVRGILNRALLLHGYEVFEAKNGTEALVRLRELAKRVDLVIADVMMPHMTGVELSQQIRRERSDLPVLLISGHVTDEMKEEQNFLAKPFTSDQLAARVRHLLDSLQ